MNKKEEISIMSGTNTRRIVPAAELLEELQADRLDPKVRHSYTAAHPVEDGALIAPGFNSKERLAEYYAGLIDGIVYAENNTKENN